MKRIATNTSAEKPQGSPFFIDTCPFEFGKQIDTAILDLAEDRVLNWPMVYILANKRFAYVGQTNSVATRIGQHSANEEKKDFTTCNIIYNDEFNTSVITDYENRLIGLMSADGKYQLTNKNDGMGNSNYFSKEKYEEMFVDLWSELQGMELADHSIQEIEESEVFKYSPYKGLTPDQHVALDTIMAAIEDGLDKARPIVVEGMPGTGKTILAIYLLKMLKDHPAYKNLNVKLLEPLPYMRATLRNALKNISGLAGNDIIGPDDLPKAKYGYTEEQGYDIILVDEAHRLKQRKSLANYGAFDKTQKTLGFGKDSNQLDWIVGVSKLSVLFYDPMQTVGPSNITSEQFRKAVGDALDSPIRLDTQMRVLGGNGYLTYIQDILFDRHPSKQCFGDYELVLHDSFADFHNSFLETQQEHNLTRLISGYAFKWISKGIQNKKSRGDDLYDICIDGVQIKWNSCFENWVGKGMNDPEIAKEAGCIHSIQGYDLSYAYVIIGNDLRYDEAADCIRVDKASYFDRKGKDNATLEDLERYIRNIYYVLLTRGIYGTHVYVCDDALRKHLKSFF